MPHGGNIKHVIGSLIILNIATSVENMATDTSPKVLVEEKKERKKSLTRGHVKDIGPTMGIQSYS